MSALPVIERELRVRARLPSTTWSRLIVGLLSGLTAISIASWEGQVQSPMKPGRALFDALGALTFVFCLVEGVRQTADSLSREKREGTIGLLFLTDLRALDIVLGKLVSASVNSFYGLLAIFPAMALALPAGGLSAGEFWRTQLALLDALFLATACGLWASARYLEETRTLVKGLGLVFGLAIVPAIFDAMFRAMSLPTISPGVATYLAGNDAAYRAAPERFWWSLLSIQGLGWMLLLLTSRRLSHTWNEEPSIRPAMISSPDADTPRDATSTEERVIPRNRALLDVNPAVWLVRRQKSRGGVIWIAVMLTILGTGASFRLINLLGSRSMALFYAVYFTAELVPLLLVAFVAVQIFGEARRSGALELLLATPLLPADIVQAHWAALWTQFKTSLMTGGALTVLLILETSTRSSPFREELWYYIAHCIAYLVRAVAACWLGMYFGLRYRTTVRAVGLTLVCTMVAPWVISSIFWLMISPLLSWAITGTAPWFFATLQVSTIGVSLAYSLGLIHWSQRQLRNRFREIAVAN